MTNTTAPLWATLTPDEHEFEYNPQKSCPDFAAHGARRTPLNEQARAWPKAQFDLSYGDHPLRKLDIYPAKQADAPAHLFLHGGYWRAQDKQNFAFIGSALASMGVTAILANYELCPASTLDGVVDSALAAFEWTCRHIADYGADAGRLGLSGHSAGAHLAAAMLSTDWAARGLRNPQVSGAVLISGIFDPTPAMITTVNQQIQLDAGLAARNNLESWTPQIACPVTLAVGASEPAQWIAQSHRYAEHLRRHGYDAPVHELPGHDHFSILDDYLIEDSAIMRAIRSHAGL
jgi:arylformamidase